MIRGVIDLEIELFQFVRNTAVVALLSEREIELKNRRSHFDDRMLFTTSNFAL